jgi:hypothetical protein
VDVLWVLDEEMGGDVHVTGSRDGKTEDPILPFNWFYRKIQF